MRALLTAVFPSSRDERTCSASPREHSDVNAWLTVMFMQTHGHSSGRGPAVQFGIFTVGDVTRDPTTGRVPTEHERIKAMVTLAEHAEAVGLDVFATGEHHNPPFVPSSPTTLLGHIAARTERLVLSTSTTLITTNDPVKIAEDYAMLQHLADGRVD